MGNDITILNGVDSSTLVIHIELFGLVSWLSMVIINDKAREVGDPKVGSSNLPPATISRVMSGNYYDSIGVYHT